MRYLALATDYDGTLAHDGKVDEATVAALRRFRASGRRLILVTGRVMPELEATFGHLELFERIVAENGALLHDPATKEEKTLTLPPKPEFVESLKKQGVSPISTGRVIVATWEPHEKTVLKTIRDMGLEMQIIFNKGAVMVLPSGVNKATGLKATLKILGLTPSQCIGVGDAENDHAMLTLCAFGVAVSNALPAVKEHADLVTEADHGAGVAELIDRVLADDLAGVQPKPRQTAGAAAN
jgi:phosphoglycolate phosphatase (TIGR01487 family)